MDRDLTARVDAAGLRVLTEGGVAVLVHPQPAPLFIDEANDWLTAQGWEVTSSWICGFTGWEVGPPSHVRPDYYWAATRPRLLTSSQEGACGRSAAPHVAACYCDRPRHDDDLHACLCGGLWRERAGRVQTLIGQRTAFRRAVQGL